MRFKDTRIDEKVNKDNILVTVAYIPMSILNLNKTFDCGQCFRWKCKANGTWVGLIGEKIFLIRNSKIIDDKTGKEEECIISTATKEEWKEILWEYFDLDTDYNIKVKPTDNFAIKSIQYSQGIRILRQDPWEMIVTFIISQRNSIPKIAKMVDRIAMTYGNEVSLKIGNEVYTEYTFPSAARLSKLSMNDFTNLGLGYRDKYIYDVVASFNSNPNELFNLSMMSDWEIINQLTRYYGIGPKVANCIALFGFHMLEMFPIDTHVKAIIDRYYGGVLNPSEYGRHAGVLQQYMFYYKRENNL